MKPFTAADFRIKEIGLVKFYLYLSIGFLTNRPPKQPNQFIVWLYTLPFKLWHKPCLHTGETFSQYLLRSGVNLPKPLLKYRMILILVSYLWPVVALRIIWKYKKERLKQWRFALSRPDLYSTFPMMKFSKMAMEERRSDILAAISHAYYYHHSPSRDYEIEDKNIFQERMAQFGLPHIPSLEKEEACASGGDFIVKSPLEEMGQGIALISAAELQKLEVDTDLIIQPVLKNHKSLLPMLPPNPPLCTLRILTGIDGNEVEVYTAYFRMGPPGEIVDNLSRDGFLVELDKISGEMLWGVSSKGMRENSTQHEKMRKYPGAQSAFAGQYIPFFEKAVAQCSHAHEKIAPNVQSIGWDVAICDEGPIMVEANVFSGSYEIFNFNDVYKKNIAGVYNKLHALIP